MTIQQFLLGLAIGSALIGFWAALRFPERAPENFGTALVHVVLSLALGWAAAGLLVTLVGFGKTVAFAAVFAVVLPALIYTFLAGAWFLKLAHGMISQHRH